MKDIFLIKFGGSLISDKNKINIPKLDNIRLLTDQIRKASAENPDRTFIVATGAGGFGHPEAKKYRHNLLEGRSLIKAAVKKLNRIVVESFTGIGLEAISMEPDRVSKYSRGILKELSYEYVVKVLNKKIIPVFHADLVDDESFGISILSMDKFIIDLAIYLKKKKFPVTKVIFAGSTPGVTDSSGNTILRLTNNILKENNKIFFKTAGIDVSGGMAYKVKESLRLSKVKIPVIIINGAEEDNLYKSIIGANFTGTIVEE